MTRDEIVVLFARREKALNNQDVEALIALLCGGGRGRKPAGRHASGACRNRRGRRRILRGVQRRDNDHVTISIIDGDRVVQVFTLSGTDTGGLMGMAPSGKPALLPMVVVCRVADGLIVHERRIYDFTGHARADRRVKSEARLGRADLKVGLYERGGV